MTDDKKAVPELFRLHEIADRESLIEQLQNLARHYADLKAQNSDYQPADESLRDIAAAIYRHLNPVAAQPAPAEAVAAPAQEPVAWQGRLRDRRDGNDGWSDWTKWMECPKDTADKFAGGNRNNATFQYEVRPLYAAPQPAQEPCVDGDVVKAWEHVANEWADVATNGYQWLKNVRDGISTLDEALADMEIGFEYCRSVARAARAIAPQPAAPVQGEDAPHVRPTVVAKCWDETIEKVAAERGLEPKYLRTDHPRIRFVFAELLVAAVYGAPSAKGRE